MALLLFLAALLTLFKPSFLNTALAAYSMFSGLASFVGNFENRVAEAESADVADVPLRIAHLICGQLPKVHVRLESLKQCWTVVSKWSLGVKGF